ncbi:hypothetical protein HID58_025750, partial [Brassica napus]
EIKSFYASTGSGYISESWRSRSGSDRSFKRRLQACARGFGERNIEMVQRNHMEQFYCNLCAECRIALSDENGRLHDAKNETLLYYGIEEATEEFPVTAEEEPPPDLFCCSSDGAAKNLCLSVCKYLLLRLELLEI